MPRALDPRRYTVTDRNQKAHADAVLAVIALLKEDQEMLDLACPGPPTRIFMENVLGLARLLAEEAYGPWAASELEAQLVRARADEVTS